jgi:hypothetical protein
LDGNPAKSSRHNYGRQQGRERAYHHISLRPNAAHLLTRAPGLCSVMRGDVAISTPNRCRQGAPGGYPKGTCMQRDRPPSALSALTRRFVPPCLQGPAASGIVAGGRLQVFADLQDCLLRAHTAEDSCIPFHTADWAAAV